MVFEPVTITPLNQSAGSLAATLSDVGENGMMRLKLTSRLSEGMAVRIDSSESYSATGRVLYCAYESGFYYATICIQQDDERRAETRIVVSEPAQITSMQPQLMSINCRGTVIDVSASGLGLISKNSGRIPTDTAVKIVLETGIVFGQVRHCTPVPLLKAYKIGVKIQTVMFRSDASPSGSDTN